MLNTTLHGWMLAIMMNICVIITDIVYIIWTYVIFFSLFLAGSQSDGGVWANCAFGQALNANEIDFPLPKELPGTDVILPFTFVADEAFPLGIHMMRPYAITYRTFGDAERIFNYRLSRARRVIENAFGIMASRWRILRRDLCCTPETAEDVVKAIVCLHNFLMISEEDSAPSKRIYCPAVMLDREINEEIIEGDWRREVYRGPITDIGRLGSNNPTLMLSETF